MFSNQAVGETGSIGTWGPIIPVETFSFECDGYIYDLTYGPIVKTITSCNRCKTNKEKRAILQVFKRIASDSSAKSLINCVYVCVPCFETLRIIPDIPYYESLHETP